jgi:hypothetical protein
LPSFIIDGWFMSELNRLYLVGRGEHFVLDCSTYQVRARFPRTYSQTFGLYSWNWRRQKLYTSPYMGVDSITVFDAAADTIMRMIPRVGDAGVYVGSTDRFYRPLAHIGLVGIDCATDTVVSTIPVPESGYGFSHPSWDSVGNRLYVPIDRWGYPPKVAVYDCATDSLLTLIDVPSLPNVMNFDYARHKAYYTPFDLTGSAGAIDIEHDSVIRLFPFNSGNPWNGVALDTTDRKAYILGADTITGYPELFIVDCTTDSIIKELTFPHKPWPVDFLQWVPWSNRVYLTRRQASSHQNLGMYVVDCKTDSVIVSDLVLGYWPPFDFQIDPIRERVFAIGAESTSVHVLRDVVSGVAETPTPGPKPGTPFKLRELRDAVELEYHLEAPCWVDVAVFDPCGRRIKTLVSARQMPGRHDLRWDRTDWYETKVARGAYFVLLDTGTEQARLKAVVR